MGDNLFDIARINTQVLKALDRRVWLESGGNLVFDPCEAMTVIDVNTAKFTGKTALADTVLQTNLEACEEIARQVRLRNISGIIIIDMIDMVSREHHHAVLETLNKAFASDRVKTVVHGFTSLGLVEMTRKRTRPALREVYKKQPQLEE
jgi:ribonuclease G